MALGCLSLLGCFLVMAQNERHIMPLAYRNSRFQWFPNGFCTPYGFHSTKHCLTAQLPQVKQILFLKFHPSNMAQSRTKKKQFWTLTDLYMNVWTISISYIIYLWERPFQLSIPTKYPSILRYQTLCTPIHPVEVSLRKYKYDLLIQNISFWGFQTPNVCFHKCFHQNRLHKYVSQVKSRYIGDKLIPPWMTESLFHGAL